MNHGKHGPHGRLIEADATYRVRGAAFEVYRAMGAGFLEAVYQECLALEFDAQDIPFRALQPLELKYKGCELRQRYTPDFVCFDTILVELKAVRTLAPEHRAQTINYLRASSLKVGLLVNFGAVPGVQIERLVL